MKENKQYTGIGKQFLTPAQLGDRWSHHVETIRRKIRRAEIPCVIIGRRLLVPLDEIENIERAGSLPATNNHA